MQLIGSSPVRVLAQGEAVRHVSVGGAHMACVTETGRVYTWGASFAGQLGHECVV